MTAATIDAEQAMDAAFAGGVCQLVDPAGRQRPLATRRGRGAVDDADRALLLDRCRGRTIDVGCGPGRLVAELTAIDVSALGIDISLEAVRQARRRGALAIRRDVFAPVPGEGRWDCALLADGNIGIGGHPEDLLRRVGRIVRPGGHVVVELGPVGTDVVRHRWRLRVGSRLTPEFDWAAVGLDAIDRLAHTTGFEIDDQATAGDRHVAVLRNMAPR
jgi:SAM-dependent methyltransferase